jgi:hypothetical protein
MVKLKATKKEMREGYYYILSVGYCDMQSLLRERQPFAYSSRAEGWACDYYEIDGVLISEGYAPLSNKNMKCDYSLIREYENKALEIDSLGLYLDERKDKKTALVKELLNKMKKPMKYEE